MADADNGRLVTDIVAIVITVMWALSIGADIIVADYDPPSMLHTAMMAVIAGLWGTRMIR